jgi:hypothetical protein
VLHAGPSLRRPHSEALHARGQERSLHSRRCAIPSGLWAAAPHGFRGAYRRDGQGLEYAPDGILASQPHGRYHQAVPDQEASAPHRDALLVELQEALGSVRHWQMLGIQTAGFIIAANIVLIGYGLSQKEAGMFLLGSVLPLTLLAVHIAGISSSTNQIALAIRIEDELHIHERHSLARIYARNYLRSAGPQLEAAIAQGPRGPNLSLKMFITPGAIVLYAFILGQVGLFVLYLVHYHYRIV